MKDKNKQLNKMDIIRGIIGFTTDGKIGVDSPFHFYDLKINEPYTDKLEKDDKLLGVIINDVFHICYECATNDVNENLGYIVGSSNENTIEVQTIKGFDKTKFNPYEPSYEIGRIVSVRLEDVKI